MGIHKQYTYILVHLHYGTPTLLYKCSMVHLQYGVANMQGLLVHNMRYLASVVSNCFTAFGELLALNKRFAELSGGVTRYPTLTHSTHCIVCCHAKLACVRSICYVVQPSLTSGQGPSSDLLSAPLPCKSIALAGWVGLYPSNTAMQVQVRCYL